MTPSVIAAADAAEFLALLPRMLGFHARRSVVLVPFARTRTLGAMRLDLPPDELGMEAFAATGVGMVCRVPDADGIALVVYADAPFCSDGSPPHAALARAILDKADACGLATVDALCVAADGWGSFLRPPSAPRPLAELGPQPRGAEHLSEPRADQWAGCELPEPEQEAVDAVRAALDSLSAAIAALCGSGGGESDRIDPLALDAAARLDDLPALFEGMLGWDASALAPFDTASAVWCLSRPALRDIALVGWVAGPGACDLALSAQLRWERGEPYPEDLARIMWGDGVQPDPQRLVTALEVARATAAVTPHGLRPGPLAVCAWLSWAAGRSTHAASYAKRAVEIEPEHGLAEIVLSFVTANHLPDWAFSRP